MAETARTAVPGGGEGAGPRRDGAPAPAVARPAPGVFAAVSGTAGRAPSGEAAQAPPALLPTDRPRRPSASPGQAGPARTGLARTPLGRAAGAATEAQLLAAFAAVLHRYTGQDAFSFAVSPRPPGDGTPRVSSYHVTADATLAELSRQAVGQGGSPCAGGYEFVLSLPAGVAGAGAGPPSPPTAELRYDAALFDGSTMDRLLVSYRTLLADGLARPGHPVARLRLLPEAELHRMLVEWNATEAELPHDVCLHAAFERAVGRAPEAVALVDGVRRWTYREINTAANRLAHHLRGLGIGPDRRVGICLYRSPDLLVAVLGVLKAGGAYVPLDPEYPRRRLAAMTTGSSCAAIVSGAGPAGRLPAPETRAGVPLVLLDRDAPLLARYPEDDPVGGAGPENLAYVIHTSGSTGAPKPIAVRHRGVANNLADLNTRFSVGPGDRVLALSSPSFDMSVYEFLGLTLAGGTVILPEPGRARDPEHWAGLLTEQRVTVWNSAPALLELTVEHLESSGSPPLSSLRLALLGGDWIPLSLPDRVRALAPNLRFVALGGATEVSIHSTLHEVASTDPAWTSIPYGRPMANQRAYILDASLQPVPPGVPGELHLAGIGLARGYLDQPERTAERFLDWSCGEVTGERLYRTGDVARYGPDGLIELLGRRDFQVKLRGMRVELGEIEAVLRSHDTVKDAVVAAREDGAGERRLIAYVTARPGRAPAPRELREHAARALPGFMVPAAVLVLDALPLTANGKVDRGALPAPPDPAGAGSAPHTSPATETESVVADVLAQVLRLEHVGTETGFLALGGNSLQALRAVNRLSKHFGIRVNVRLLYGGGSVRAIASAIDQRLAEAP
ncbi:non-ribosomal peptide synthetase [Streptomyces sp. WMMC897]|uniref:non-ribosomal peptide synthetase n=1 Tax=Streptomyces sp. WMMC897 TaxID=3014782 RepID=UPI0022B6015A|nr:amino acid adenylation domain-containing protein [Streptomyces sp. WMMC897]MCZ7415531.1 amino acid adenylation domain-containing protein [Streptomyces sp. WMMC897]